jgi:signal transduction histidine kinase/EAL domain-containing protein (putative c-di-GMP-specific phosphodiesterase class I)
MESSARVNVVAIVGVGLILLCLLGASVIFANSEGTTAVAEDAAIQVRVQGMIGAVGISRAVFSEALILGVAFRNGEVPADRFEAIIDDANAVLGDLGTRITSLQQVLTDGGLKLALDDYAASAASLLDDLEAGAVEAAQGRDAEALRDTSDRAVDLLVAERDARERNIAAVRAGVGQVANAVRFVVAFFVPLIGVLWFLVATRRRQRRLRAAADIAREESMRAAKDEFLAAVAHELRTPLTAVVGFAETLRDESRHLSARDREEVVDILADQATHTAAIVEDLLVFARSNVGDLRIRIEPVQLRDLVERVTVPWASSTPSRLTVRGDAHVEADPFRLRQVIRNLVSNAFDHGGPHVEVRMRQTGPRVTIEVADDGIGIPPETRAEIFEPFLGARRDGQPANIGLGLTVARSLVRLMDGELDYAYRSGESIFSVTLPAASPDAIEIHELERPAVPTHWPTASQVMETLSAGNFEMVYQPIVDLHGADRQVIGYEALTRFPRGSPHDWFAMADIAGLGIDLQLATIRAAIAGFARMPHSLFLAVNLSMETLSSPKLPDALMGLAARRIVLELSEETVIDNYTRAKVYLDRLVRKGYRIAFDDLARGRIDPWYLVRLRPAIVKVDISLVRNIDTEPNRRALLNGLKWLGDILGSRIVAEGIERPEELATVTRLGVHFGQGFLLGYPGPLPQVSAPQPSLVSNPEAAPTATTV